MNLNLVIDTGNFKPYDFDRYYKVLLDYDTTYLKEREIYDTLTLKLGDLKSAVQGSEKAKGIYDDYMNKLNNAAARFAHGRNYVIGRELSELRNLYGTDIRQLENARESLLKEVETRRNELAKDDSMVYKNNNLSIDEFMNGTPLNMGGISANKVTLRVAGKAEALGKALFSDPIFKKFLNGEKYQIMLANGATPADMALVMALDVDSIPDEELQSKLRSFSDMVLEEYDSIGIEQYSPSDLNKLKNAVNTGLYSGLSTPTYTYQDNGEYIDAEARQRLAISKLSSAIEKERWELERQNKLTELNAPIYRTLNNNLVSIEKPLRWQYDDKGNLVSVANTDAGKVTITPVGPLHTGSSWTLENQQTLEEQAKTREEKLKNFEGWDFTLLDDNRKVEQEMKFGDRSKYKFDEEDAEPIAFEDIESKISPQMYLALVRKFELAGLNPDDFELYYDLDRKNWTYNWYNSSNHLRVVPKNGGVSWRPGKSIPSPNLPSLGEALVGTQETKDLIAIGDTIYSQSDLFKGLTKEELDSLLDIPLDFE